MHQVTVLALDGVYPFELGMPERIFGALPEHYAVSTCTVDGRPVRANADFTISVTRGPEALETADTVVIPPFDMELVTGGLPEPVMAALARIRPGTRIVSICTGAFLLAATGLLDGRPATTHWGQSALFRQMFPAVRLDQDVLFVDDGDVLTSAGAASGVDVCLHLVRRDHGSKIATPWPAGAWSRRCATAGRRSSSTSRCRIRR